MTEITAPNETTRLTAQTPAGTLLRVRDWDDMMAEFGPTGSGNIGVTHVFSREMRRACGQTVTLKCLSSDETVYFEPAAESEFGWGRYNWSRDMFVLADETPEQKEVRLQAMRERAEQERLAAEKAAKEKAEQDEKARIEREAFLAGLSPKARKLVDFFDRELDAFGCQRDHVLEICSILTDEPIKQAVGR